MKFLSMGNFYLLPYLFIPSFTYISKDLWIFILYFGLYFNTVLFCSSHCSSFGHLELFGWLLCPFDVPSSLCLFAPVLLSCIFLTPVAELAISPRMLNSFYWTRVLGTKNWVLAVIIVAGVIASKPSQLTEQGNK